MSKIACVFFNISNADATNYVKDDFFAPNAVNSFKKWHPDIEVLFITSDNWDEYLAELGIKEYYDNIGLVRIHVIKELMRVREYTKVIMLGIDTFTCARLDEFLEDNTTDMICSAGPQLYVQTEYWATPGVIYDFEGKKYQELAFINADVACFNNVKAAETLYNKSVEYWTVHCEQGGMNYCFSNQDKVGIIVRIVDFPYLPAKSLYNVMSKGAASGGYCMVKGKLLNGRNGDVISNIYPTTEYRVIDNKLYTKDDKQIKVFHYAEGLINRTDKDELSYSEQVNEMKTMWFNKETIKFLEEVCDCKF